MGPMPKSRAAVIGLGFAAQNKGDAAKMFADPDKWGKEAQNKIDERCSNTGEQIARLDSIASSIKPEHPDLRGSPKGGGLSARRLPQRQHVHECNGSKVSRRLHNLAR